MLQTIRQLANRTQIADLMKEARRLRNEGHSVITFSPKVQLSAGRRRV